MAKEEKAKTAATATKVKVKVLRAVSIGGVYYAPVVNDEPVVIEVDKSIADSYGPSLLKPA